MLVRFPSDETGKACKFSRPWHVPYCVVDIRDPDTLVVKVYRPQDGRIQIHQARVTPCPPAFPAGYFWYALDLVTPQKWVDKLLQEEAQEPHVSTATSMTDNPECHNECPDDQSEDELSADESEVYRSEPETVVTHPQSNETLP